MRFEDLDVWKRAARLSAEIYRELRDLRDYSFRDQMSRAGLSVASNIAEGFERESIRECLNFLSYAKGSCGELRTQIYIGMEAGYIPTALGREWIAETQRISAMLTALIATRRSFVRPLKKKS